jgi:hypothetical protein
MRIIFCLFLIVCSCEKEPIINPTECKECTYPDKSVLFLCGEELTKAEKVATCIKVPCKN